MTVVCLVGLIFLIKECIGEEESFSIDAFEPEFEEVELELMIREDR